ncbi:Protein MAIN-LIKE 1 [Glycine soja]
MLVHPVLFLPHVPSSFCDCRSSSSSSEHSSDADNVVVAACSSSTLLLRVLLHHLDFACSSSLLVLLHRGLVLRVFCEVDNEICGRHLHIMVKTRGLGHALGRVVGRGLGRGDGDDSNVPADLHAVPEAEPVVAGDKPMVDADAQDTVAETDAQDTGVEDVVDEAEGFPGGPRDPSVLTEYAKHVAASVWSGEERSELKLSSHGRKVHKLDRPIPAIEEMVARTGLSPLIACSIDTGDRGLISSFVERWHRETSIFHLSTREVSIMLDDVASLLHLPIVGDFHAFRPLHIDEVVLMLVELLMPWPRHDIVLDHTYTCLGYETFINADVRPSTGHLQLVLNFCIFWSATHVHDEFLDTLCDLTQTRRYAWGAAGLIHMYDQLNDASISTNRQMVGYITLLQSAMLIRSTTMVSPRACRWIATKNTVKKISTATYRQRLDRLRIPYVICGAPISPRLSSNFMFLRIAPLGACCCQIQTGKGHALCIPAHRVDSWVSFDDVDDRWTHYSDHLVPAGDICVVPGQCAPDYIDWFFVISHSFMTAPQTSNPPRDAFAMQPRHIPQEPAPASTHKDSDVNEPKHAVEACHAIAETLEQHLNEVMSSTSTHEVIQKCLRIVKGVTEDGNVYVRSRHRRRTD